MTKKMVRDFSDKQAESPADKQIVSPVDKSEKKEEEGMEASIELPYILGRWGTFTQYKCRFCEFDTLYEDKILGHIWSVHGPKFEKSKILGYDGLPMIKEI
jgi:hypothetical protein